ncbi:HAMP domain-containing histidine kinase, partial [bacterium]
VSIPKQVVFAEANRLLVERLLVLGIVSLVTLTAAWLGTNAFILRPVNTLVGTAKRLGAGDLTARTGLPHGEGELNQLARAFDEMAANLRGNMERVERQAAELERANKAKDEFLSVMSHELRTPLNVVMGYTGMIKDGMLGEINQEQMKALEKVTNRSGDLLRMINEILVAASLESGTVKVEIHEVNLVDFLDDLRSHYEVPSDKELTLNWDYPPQLPMISIDSGKLKHILQNLIDNAVKFTNGGHITISARYIPDAQAMNVKVADTGIGIQKELLPSIFEMFHQVDSSETRSFGGVGVGLYIVKKYTDMLGGKIEVESEPDRGSTFTVTIPC